MKHRRRRRSTSDEAFGRIDVLVNNAGYSLLGNFEELSTAEIEGLISTNLYGVIYVMRAVLPVMRKQRSGRIINISSLAGVIGFKHCGAYSAAKFAVEGLSISVAQEVEQFGIKVMVVAPGFFRTDLLDARNAKYAPAPSRTTPRKATPKTCGRAMTANSRVIPSSSATSL